MSPYEIERKANSKGKAHAGQGLLAALALRRDDPRARPVNQRITSCPGMHERPPPRGARLDFSGKLPTGTLVPTGESVNGTLVAGKGTLVPGGGGWDEAQQEQRFGISKRC